MRYIISKNALKKAAVLTEATGRGFFIIFATNQKEAKA